MWYHQSSFTSNLNYVVYDVTIMCLIKLLILLNYELVVYLKSVDGVFADRFGLVVVFIHTVPKLFPEVLHVVNTKTIIKYQNELNISK